MPRNPPGLRAPVGVVSAQTVASLRSGELGLPGFAEEGIPGRLVAKLKRSFIQAFSLTARKRPGSSASCRAAYVLLAVNETTLSLTVKERTISSCDSLLKTHFLP